MAKNEYKKIGAAALIAVAAEMVEVMDLDGDLAGDLTGKKAKDIAALIKDEADYTDKDGTYGGVRSNDNFKDETWEVFKKIGCATKILAERKDAAAKVAQAKETAGKTDSTAAAKKKAAADKKAATAAAKAKNTPKEKPATGTPATKPVAKKKPAAARKDKAVRDEFGFIKGSTRAKFAASLARKPKTMKQIMKEKWNEKGQSQYNAWKALVGKGLGKMDGDKMTIIKKK